MRLPRSCWPRSTTASVCRRRVTAPTRPGKLFLPRVGVRRRAVEHLRALHQRLRQRRVRVHGLGEIANGCAHLDGKDALGDQLACAVTADADAEDAFGPWFDD